MRSSSARSTALGSKISNRLPPTPIEDCTPWLALASTWVTLAIFSPICTPPMLAVMLAERGPISNTCEANASQQAFGQRRGGEMVAAQPAPPGCVRRNAPPRRVPSARAPSSTPRRRSAIAARMRVGRIQADVLQQALVVVRFQQQQAVLALVLRGAGDGVLQRMQEGRAVEQAGDLVALAQFLDLARQFRIGFLAPEHDLQAGFAFVQRRGEFHHRGKRIAFDVARFQFVARRRRLALAQRLEQLLEAVHVLRADQVQQRHALDVLERVEAEHLQVRADWRGCACLHARRRSGRARIRSVRRNGVRFRAPAPRAGAASAALPGRPIRRGPRPAAAGACGAGRCRARRRRAPGSGWLRRRDRRPRSPAGPCRCLGPVAALHPAATPSDCWSASTRSMVCAASIADSSSALAGPQRTHRDTGIAQCTDDRLGVLDAVVDDHQAQCGVGSVLHSVLRAAVIT